VRRILTPGPGRPCLGLAALVLALGASCSQPPAPPAPATPPHILLVTIDTLRADRLGRGFTPTLDGLAAEGVRFTHARAGVPLTLPSHATILSGLLPPRHGVRENATYRFDAEHPTIASVLEARGYRTAAVVGAFVLDRQFGLDAGFDSYDDRIPRSPDADVRLESERPAAAVTDAALAWAERAAEPPGSPFFLWVHYYDPHAPYDPPAQHLASAGGQRYDGEVAYVDAELRRLLDGLSARGLQSETMVVVAGDHGESLGEHGERTHGMLLYDAAVRVPLIVKLPGQAKPAVRTDPASLADIAPTILGAVGRAAPGAEAPGAKAAHPPMDGVDLLSAPQPADRELYAETNYPRVAGWTPLRSLVSGPWKLVGSSPPELYDVVRDPGEATNLAAQRTSMASAMAARLAEMDRRSAATPSAPSREAQDRLRALGYVAASPSAPVPADAPSPAREIASWGAFEDALTDVASGRRERALPVLARLAAKYPNAQVFRKTHAQALLDAGRANEALPFFRALAAKWPTDASLLHDQAVAARAAGKAPEAVRAEQAAIALDPKYPAAHNGLGLLHADAGNVREARASFQRAAELEPSNPSHWANLGNTARDLGELARAAGEYERALAIDPSWRDAANGLGVVLVQGNRAAEAVPWFEKAVARSPGFVEAQLNLGIALQQAGQSERAKAQYRKVLAAPGRYRAQREAAAKLLGELR
jgi:arylsulfatase A-like enzyme/Flp pilus assembly protein TadD